MKFVFQLEPTHLAFFNTQIRIFVFIELTWNSAFKSDHWAPYYTSLLVNYHILKKSQLLLVSMKVDVRTLLVRLWNQAIITKIWRICLQLMPHPLPLSSICHSQIKIIENTLSAMDLTSWKMIFLLAKTVHVLTAMCKPGHAIPKFTF